MTKASDSDDDVTLSNTSGKFQSDNFILSADQHGSTLKHKFVLILLMFILYLVHYHTAPLHSLLFLLCGVISGSFKVSLYKESASIETERDFFLLFFFFYMKMENTVELVN